MLSPEWALEFAKEWIEAWNAHDLDRILSHYRDDFEMHSPLIVQRMGIASGSLTGKDAIRPYWAMGLAAQPPLHFELRDVLVGTDSLAIYYWSRTRNRMVAEVLTFDTGLKVVRGAGLYAVAYAATDA
jgi:ketosteroid isomerase-like protein